MNAAAALRVQVIEDRARIPLSPQQWNELIAGNETNTVFQTFEWFDAWWKNFGEAHQLFFLVVHKGERIIGFAGLMLTRVGRRQQLEFVGTGNADYQDFVLPIDKQDAVQAICAFLREQDARWQRAWLCNIPSQSTTLHCLAQAGRRVGLYFVDETHMPCPALRIDGHQGAARQLIDKYSVRRPLNWFAKNGAIRFRHVTVLAEIEALLPAFFDQHIRRRRAAGESSLFENAQQRRFYETLARAAHAGGWLLFSVVEFNNEPIAFHFGFDYLRSVTWYKPSFEIGYAERSPGLVLIRALIEDGIARGRQEIDFTIGDEPFKERFSNVERSNVYVGVYHRRAGYLVGLAEKEARRVAGRTLRRIRAAVKRALALRAPNRQATEKRVRSS